MYPRFLKRQLQKAQIKDWKNPMARNFERKKVQSGWEILKSEMFKAEWLIYSKRMRMWGI